jgi:hypothetical protein
MVRRVEHLKRLGHQPFDIEEIAEQAGFSLLNHFAHWGGIGGEYSRAAGQGVEQ